MAWGRIGKLGAKVHAGVYVGFLAVTYAALLRVSPSALEKRLDRLPTRVSRGLPREKLKSFESSKGQKFVAAWMLTKLAEPVRLAITMGVTAAMWKYKRGGN